MLKTKVTKSVCQYVRITLELNMSIYMFMYCHLLYIDLYNTNSFSKRMTVCDICGIQLCLVSALNQHYREQHPSFVKIVTIV